MGLPFRDCAVMLAHLATHVAAAPCRQIRLLVCDPFRCNETPSALMLKSPNDTEAKREMVDYQMYITTLLFGGPPEEQQGSRGGGQAPTD
eukprot:41639-Eustigmatos_ZCMA.PRE.1